MSFLNHQNFRYFWTTSVGIWFFWIINSANTLWFSMMELFFKVKIETMYTMAFTCAIKAHSLSFALFWSSLVAHEACSCIMIFKSLEFFVKYIFTFGISMCFSKFSIALRSFSYMGSLSYFLLNNLYLTRYNIFGSTNNVWKKPNCFWGELRFGKF